MKVAIRTHNFSAQLKWRSHVHRFATRSDRLFLVALFLGFTVVVAQTGRAGLMAGNLSSAATINQLAPPIGSRPAEERLAK
jgi:hypothetical protein